MTSGIYRRQYLQVEMIKTALGQIFGPSWVYEIRGKSFVLNVGKLIGIERYEDGYVVYTGNPLLRLKSRIYFNIL